MRSQHEPQVFSAVIRDCGIEGKYLVETSTTIFSPTVRGEAISWDEVNTKISAYSEFDDSSFSVKKDTYNDLVLMNNETYLFTPSLFNQQPILISETQFNQLNDDDNQRWSVFHWLTRPGFSPDFSQALIQIYAHCPSGPPQYGSILYLERTGERWVVKSSYGLYNQ
jgi:hypothetical protein